MATLFDPYHKWLGIPPAEQPPDHYRLLGLSLHEDDSDVITLAARRQLTHLQTVDAEGREAERQQLIAQVKLAYSCLHNPEQKALYDDRLAQRKHYLDPGVPNRQRTPQPNTEEGPSPATAAPVMRTHSGSPWVKRQQAKRRRRQITMRWLFLLSSAPIGIALGYFILTQAMPGFTFSSLWVEQPTDPISLPRRAEDGAPRRVNPPQINEALPQKRQPRERPTLPNLRSQEIPSPTQPLTRLPAAINLPNQDDRQIIVIGHLDVGDPRQLTLDLTDPFRDERIPSLEVGNLGPSGEAAIKPQNATRGGVPFESATRIAAASEPSIANLQVIDNQLTFQWNGGGSLSQRRHLRNCVLVITAETPSGTAVHHLRLRRPARLPPYKLTLDGRGEQITIPVRDFPREAELLLDVKAIDGLSINEAEEKSHTKIMPNKRGHLSFDASLRLSVTWSVRDDVLRIVANMTYQLNDGVRRPLNLEKLRDLKEDVRADGLDAVSELTAREGAVAGDLARDLRTALSMPTPQGLRNAFRLWDKSVGISSAQRALSNNDRRIDNLYKLVPRLEQKYQGLMAIESIAIELERRATMSFRIFGESQGEEFDLVVTDSDLRPDEVIVDDALGAEPVRGMNALLRDLQQESARKSK